MDSLWNSVGGEGSAARSCFIARGRRLRLAELARASLLAGEIEHLRGRHVLLATREPYFAAAAMLELDGLARRLVIGTPDLDSQRLAEVAAATEAEVIVTDARRTEEPRTAASWCVLSPAPRPLPVDRRAAFDTEWILLTSGTSGRPKLVVHSLASLGGTLAREAAANTVWSTFYDIRRYGGLQIYLRAVLGGTPLVLADPDEATPEFLARAATAGVTHISGTPSHWRRVLMSGAAPLIAPHYVRLSGEIADQALLDRLRHTYPQAQVSHAFASTEAGVGFEVDDGRAGFPADYLDRPPGNAQLRVVEGTLRIKSRRNALRYLGADAPPIAAADGYVDTGDFVERDGDRYQFRGRRGGVINVGGLKVYPEEVEAVLNADPRIRMSLVRARRNPITGAVIAADVVLSADPATASSASSAAALKAEILERCRGALAPHKVPATVRFVASLDLTAAGKIVRGDV